MNSLFKNGIQIVLFTGLILGVLFFQDDIRARFFTPDVTTDTVVVENTVTPEVEETITTEERQQTEDVFYAAREADAEFSDEELKRMQTFEVLYPSTGDTLIAGKEYTATWTAGERVRASEYTVRLVDQSYRYDVELGTAYENQQPFTFTVPTSTNGANFQLIFASMPPGLGGNSHYFSIVPTKTSATSPSEDDPVVTYFVSAEFPDTETRAQVAVGGWANYKWNIENADSFTLTESRTNCKDQSVNQTNILLKIDEIQGSIGTKINSYLAGCTITRTINAVKAGIVASATTVVEVK